MSDFQTFHPEQSTGRLCATETTKNFALSFTVLFPWDELRHVSASLWIYDSLILETKTTVFAKFKHLKCQGSPLLGAVASDMF